MNKDKRLCSTKIEIFGYTDNTDSSEFNLSFSKKRTESIKKYLISKGLVTSRFKTTGLGIEQPIATNDTPEGRSQNRRVEFVITTNDKAVSF